MSDEERFDESIDQSRRVFIKRLIGVAFAAPVIASFSFDSLASADPGVSMPNQVPPGKALVCHNGHTIEVSAEAVSAHLAHGDTLGPCSGQG